MSEPISEREQRRAHQSAADKEAERERRRMRRRLLYRRGETAELLGGLSISSVIRLEQQGKLVVVKPSGQPNGLTMHTAASVHALAGIQEAEVV